MVSKIHVDSGIKRYLKQEFNFNDVRIQVTPFNYGFEGEYSIHVNKTLSNGITIHFTGKIYGNRFGTFVYDGISNETLLEACKRLAMKACTNFELEESLNKSTIIKPNLHSVPEILEPFHCVKCDAIVHHFSIVGVFISFTCPECGQQNYIRQKKEELNVA